MAVWNCW